MHALTAAHRTFPFGTKVRVTNLENNKIVIVRINDRGPFKEGRMMDLSMGAAKEIDLIRTGTARVRMEVLEWGNGR
jgi:rare lipoprotein A